MLLRRITKHVIDQNWFAVFIDFLIVVVGILIALQITNWNEARQTSESQKLVYERLLEDFDLIEQQNDRAIIYIEKLMMSLIVLHEAVERGSVGPGEDELIKHALELAYSYPSFNQQSGTYIELLSSGRLELISDEALRIALSKYDLSVQQSRFNETRISEHLIGTGSVDLIGRYRTYEPPKRNEDGEFRRSPVPAYDIVAMSADDEFRLQLNTIVENRGFLITNVYGQRVNIKDVMTAFEKAK